MGDVAGMDSDRLREALGMRRSEAPDLTAEREARRERGRRRRENGRIKREARAAMNEVVKAVRSDYARGRKISFMMEKYGRTRHWITLVATGKFYPDLEGRISEARKKVKVEPVPQGEIDYQIAEKIRAGERQHFIADFFGYKSVGPIQRVSQMMKAGKI